jgi:hypothetical protein
MNNKKLSVDEIAEKYSRRQKLWRIGFAILLLLSLGVIIALLLRSHRQTDEAQQKAKAQESKAEAATKDVSQVSADILRQMQQLDDQLGAMTAPDNPALSIWKRGVLEQDPRRHGYAPVDPQVLAMLNTRRLLLGSVSKAMFDASPSLKAYACDHRWFVIGASLHVDNPDEWLKSRKDPRFSVTAWVSGPVHPTQRGLIVGWFLTRGDADKLVQEIDSVNHNGPFKKVWDFGFDPQGCSESVGQ